MPARPARSPRTAAILIAMLLPISASIGGCGNDVGETARVDTGPMDGSWAMTFRSDTPRGLRGGRCADGSGSFTVRDGKVTGETFQNTRTGKRAVGRAEGNLTASEDGFFISLIRSQDGRNVFTAKVQLTSSGAMGTWEDIDKCAGTFVATRA